MEPTQRNTLETEDQTQSYPLTSFGKGASASRYEPTYKAVVIRRSRRIVAKLASLEEIEEFAKQKRLTDQDRQALVRQLSEAGSEPPQPGETRVLNTIERGAQSQAERGQPSAGQPDASRQEASPGQPISDQDDELRRWQAKVLEDLERRYLHVGNDFYLRGDDKVKAFSDAGRALKTHSDSPAIARDMTELALSKGWRTLRVSGTETFKREVWLEASARGVQVVGYAPTEVDRKILEERIRSRVNAIEAATPTPARETDGVQAVLHAAHVFAKQIPDEPSREKFVQKINDTLLEFQARDKPIPQVPVKDPSGVLVKHGAAPYNFDQNESMSYYVALKDARGVERLIWGKKLQKALADAQAQIGDRISLKHVGKTAVEVEQPIRDDDGKVVGTQKVQTNRNTWITTVHEKANTAKLPGKEQQAQKTPVAELER